MINKTIIIALISILIFSCNTQTKQQEPLPQINKEEVNIFMDNWHMAAAEANFDAYFNAMDSDAVYVGTAAEEVWSKADFASFSKPYFDKGKAWSFKAINRNVYFIENSNIIYFDELLDTWMGQCRGSGVLQLNSKNQWEIKHYVLSLVVPNEDIKAVVDLIEKGRVRNNKH